MKSRNLLTSALVFLLSLVVVASFVMTNVYAQNNSIDRQDTEQLSKDVSGSLINVGAWGDIQGVGLLSLLALILQFIFVLLIVLWVLIAIFAGIRTIRSQGDPEGIQGGTKRIRNLLAGITVGLLFFIAVSFIGYFAGVGNVFDWSNSLRECSCSNATAGSDCYTFRFQAEASVEGGDALNWECSDGIGWRQGGQTPGTPGPGL